MYLINEHRSVMTGYTNQCHLDTCWTWVSGWTYQWIYNIHVNGWKTRVSKPWYMPSAVQSLFWGVWNFVGFLKERQFREHTNSEAMYLEQYLEFILVDKSICISADTSIPRNQAPHKSDLTVYGRNNFVTRTTLTPLYDSMNTGIAYKVNVCNNTTITGLEAEITLAVTGTPSYYMYRWSYVLLDNR